MIFGSFFAKMAGKFAAKKIGLEEGKVETKKWYLSKNIWTGIVVGLLGIYGTLSPQFGWPPVPEWIFALLAGLGIYTRATATTTITK